MPAQFDVFETRRGPPVVVVQSNLHGDLNTRVVVPLRREGTGRRPIEPFNPLLDVDGTRYILQTDLILTVPVRTLRHRLASAAEHRDAIVRALDFLFLGI